LILIVGLVARFAVAVLILAAMLVPIVLAIGAWHKVQALRRRAAGVDEAGTTSWARDAHYAPWHTWLAPAGAGLASIGLDALAGRLLAHVTQVQVAAPGTRLRAGESFAEVACGERRVSLRSPVDALVVKVNAEAERHPQRLRRDPYREGWLALVAPTASGMDALRAGEPARAWLVGEERRLQLSIEHALGYAAADGGDLVAETPDLLTDAQWQQVVGEFL
jgi:glycine cleavage system H lipoate-binding protein